MDNQKFLDIVNVLGLEFASKLDDERIKNIKFVRPDLNSSYMTGTFANISPYTINYYPEPIITRIRCDYCCSRVTNEMLRCPNCGAPL
jgi:hypothetical protein